MNYVIVGVNFDTFVCQNMNAKLENEEHWTISHEYKFDVQMLITPKVFTESVWF